jgi:hypothetical protein
MKAFPPHGIIKEEIQAWLRWSRQRADRGKPREPEFKVNEKLAQGNAKLVKGLSDQGKDLLYIGEISRRYFKLHDALSAETVLTIEWNNRDSKQPQRATGKVRDIQADNAWPTVYLHGMSYGIPLEDITDIKKG